MSNKPINPDPEDFAAIQREYGPLPRDATEAEVAHHYRLAQAKKLIRLYGPATNPPAKPINHYAAVERQYGRPPSDATDAELAHQYRLAQATKLLRLYSPATSAKPPSK
jgi:ABC-type anion transport system duplicated permease subunit